MVKTAEKSCSVFVVGVCHDSWKVPESQMTGDEAQLESGKRRRRGRDRQVGNQTEDTERQEMKLRVDLIYQSLWGNLAVAVRLSKDNMDKKKVNTGFMKAQTPKLIIEIYQVLNKVLPAPLCRKGQNISPAGLFARTWQGTEISDS